MGRLSPIREEQRNACMDALDELIAVGRASGVREAADIIYRTARRRHQATGFDMTDAGRFYWCIRKWYDKRREASHENAPLSKSRNVPREVS